MSWKSFVAAIAIGLFSALFAVFHPRAIASPTLTVVYPPDHHRTTAASIFLIGSAPPTGEVTIDGRAIGRSRKGYFAPSFPLKVGDNLFTVRYREQKLDLRVTRLDRSPRPPEGLGFAPGSTNPSTAITRLAGEWICFTAVATPDARVSVESGNDTLPLLPQPSRVEVPSNSAVLTGLNRTGETRASGYYRGCKRFDVPGARGLPTFIASLDGETVRQQGTGEITIVPDRNLPTIEVIAPSGIARTGPGTAHSRLTPLPEGTRASLTGKEGDWSRLDYGGWILDREIRVVADEVLDIAEVFGISSRRGNDATEIRFPLSRPVPLAVRQEDERLILTLYTTVAKTDTIFILENPLVRRLDWRQATPTSVEYTFHLEDKRQWGHDLRYEGSNLVLTLRHPPARGKNLRGTTILLDPGHGGKETGATGPTGYREKEVNLKVSRLIRRELERAGATVYLTRDRDTDLSLPDRVETIDRLRPTLSLSIHYNALPDDGNALDTKGIGIFWYHPQAHELAVFLHDYLTATLHRPSYGVYWNNLALTRPSGAPAILLELGFMSNPDEFEWITDAREQEKLARAIASGILAWFESS